VFETTCWRGRQHMRLKVSRGVEVGMAAEAFLHSGYPTGDKSGSPFK